MASPLDLKPRTPPKLLEWTPKRQGLWRILQCLLLQIPWFLYLPSHLPQKHHVLSSKVCHLLCRPKHRGNSYLRVSTFMEWKDDHNSLCITLPQTSAHEQMFGIRTIKLTPICRSTLLEQFTDATSQTHSGYADHCHMEHQKQKLPTI